MYEFPIAAETNNHKLSGLKQHTFMILKLGDQKFEMDFMGLKSRYQLGQVRPRGPRENLLPGLFQLLGGSYIPWFVAPSSFFKPSE